MAACGNSPQAQCIVGFVLSASNGLVINSESLLGEEGRELPGLKRINKNDSTISFRGSSNIEGVKVGTGEAPLDGAPLSIGASVHSSGLLE